MLKLICIWLALVGYLTPANCTCFYKQQESLKFDHGETQESMEIEIDNHFRGIVMITAALRKLDFKIENLTMTPLEQPEICFEGGDAMDIDMINKLPKNKHFLINAYLKNGKIIFISNSGKIAMVNKRDAELIWKQLGVNAKIDYESTNEYLITTNGMVTNPTEEEITCKATDKLMHLHSNMANLVNKLEFYLEKLISINNVLRYQPIDINKFEECIGLKNISVLTLIKYNSEVIGKCLPNSREKRSNLLSWISGSNDEIVSLQQDLGQIVDKYNHNFENIQQYSKIFNEDLKIMNNNMIKLTSVENKLGKDIASIMFVENIRNKKSKYLNFEEQKIAALKDAVDHSTIEEDLLLLETTLLQKPVCTLTKCVTKSFVTSTPTHKVIIHSNIKTFIPDKRFEITCQPQSNKIPYIHNKIAQRKGETFIIPNQEEITIFNMKDDRYLETKLRNINESDQILTNIIMFGDENFTNFSCLEDLMYRLNGKTDKCLIGKPININDRINFNLTTNEGTVNGINLKHHVKTNIAEEKFEFKESKLSIPEAETSSLQEIAESLLYSENGSISPVKVSSWFGSIIMVTGVLYAICLCSNKTCRVTTMSMGTRVVTFTTKLLCGKSTNTDGEETNSIAENVSAWTLNLFGRSPSAPSAAPSSELP